MVRGVFSVFQSKIFMILLAMSATHDALKSDEKVKMLMPIHNFSPKWAHEPSERTRSNQEHLPLTHQINSWVYSVACRYTQNSIHLKGLVRRGKEAEKKFHVKLFPLLKWSICNLMETRLGMSRLCTTLSLFWSMNLGKTLSFSPSKEEGRQGDLER